MIDYLQPLINELNSSANPKKAEWSEKYLKNQFKFFGLESRTFKALLKNFIKIHKLPDINKLEEISFTLWEMEEREFQYCAIIIMDKLSKKFRKDDIHWIQKLIVSKSWWDTVDGLATWICGQYFKMYPDQVTITQDWIDSGNMWLQRTALIFQLKYKENTNTELLSKYIIQLAEHKDFFIRKAIGWILREYSKTNKLWVREFVSNHKLSGLSFREATKYC
jgi:3-methyladenine DNA glycosylase AlkD